MPNLHRILAESPAALEAYSALWTISDKTGFTPQERNIAYLAIIYGNECTYCMAGHTNLSRMAKADAAAITAVRERKPIADAKLEALRQFAAKVTRQRGVVSEADSRVQGGARGARRARPRRDQAHLQLHQRPLHEGRRMDGARQLNAVA